MRYQEEQREELQVEKQRHENELKLRKEEQRFRAKQQEDMMQLLQKLIVDRHQPTAQPSPVATAIDSRGEEGARSLQDKPTVERLDRLHQMLE